MVVVMDLSAPQSNIDKVISRIELGDCRHHIIYGASKIVIGVTGQTQRLTEDDFLTMDSVIDVMRVSKKYKLVSREVKDEDTIINLNGNLIGGEDLFICAGPCSVESRQQVFDIAGELKEMGVKYFRAGAYKPRTSPYAFQGLKEKGLEYLNDVKKELGMMIVTEAKDSSNLDQLSEVSDIIQIGARNMQNFSLLEEVGKLKNPILLKRGLAASIEDLLMSAEYILSEGNYNVILCERGIRTFETMTRNTLDLNAVPVIKQQSHLPIIVDPSHGVGIWDKVPPMAMASVACGADGIIVEVHNKPEQALSDGAQSLTPKNFKIMLDKLKELAPVVNKKVNL